MSAAVLAPAHEATLEAMLARLIPADDLGAGAREAGVMTYVQAALGDWHRHTAKAYAAGLDHLQEAARSVHDREFAACEPAEQDALLAHLEGEATTNAFFELVRTHAIEGMFGDPRWGGNAGHAGWNLLGYPGPRTEWTAEDQRIVALDGGPA